MPSANERTVVYIEKQGDVLYTYYDDGLVKITKYKKKKIYWGRIIVALIVFTLFFSGILQLIKATANAIKSDKRTIDPKTDMSRSFEFDSSTADVPAVFNNDTVADDSSTSQKDLSAMHDGAYPNMELKVCIDPGHGDIDNGAVAGEGIVEKDQTLEMGLLVRDYLESCGVTVIMTRDSDVNISLADRCSTANQAGADLFVSIHRNTATDLDFDMRGVEAWVNNKQPVFDTLLAQNILDELVNVGISQNLGVKYGYSGIPASNYQVNMDTVMPSCMLELGYVTDSADNELYAMHKSDYARAIGDAVIRTAIELGAVSEDGMRLLGEQLLSDGKSNVTVN